MKIVHIITRFLKAGAEQNTLLSCNFSAENGDAVTLIVGRDCDETMVAKLDPRVDVIRVPSLIRAPSPIHDVRAFFALRAILKQRAPDIVHTHTSKAGILGRAAARALGIGGIVHGVHIAPFVNVGTAERVLYLNLEKLCARWTKAFIHVSRGMRDAFQNAGIGAPETHSIVYSGMELSEFRNPAPLPNWREVLDCPEGSPQPTVLLMMAAYETRKRHAELIAALDPILASDPNLRLVFVGDGPERARVEALARTRPQVRLAGFQTRPGDFVALADLCVHCSEREGLPRVVVQYMAASKPVVIMELPGIDEVVRDGVNGIIVPADDFAAFADTVRTLLADRGRLAALSAGAAATDVSGWEARRQFEGNQVIYERLVPSAA